MDKQKTPRFRVTKTNPPQVFLQCSGCYKDLKEIKPNGTVDVTRAYYCNDCETNQNVITLNPSIKKEDSNGR